MRPVLPAGFVLLALAACGAPTKPDAPAPPSDDQRRDATAATEARIAKRTAESIKLDGFALGDTYASLMTRPPYDKPCDDDPVDAKKTTRAMIYTANECRGHNFPDGTSVIVFIPQKSGAAEFDVPIVAVAWFGGRYFGSRSNLGLRVGDTRIAVRDLLGEPRKTLAISERWPLTVEVYDGQFFAIFDGDLAAGYGIGRLPASPQPTDEHWRAVEQMYRRYTERVTGMSPADARAACETIFDKYLVLMRAEPDMANEADDLAKRRSDAITHCAREITTADIECAKRATTFTAMRACEAK